MRARLGGARDDHRQQPAEPAVGRRLVLRFFVHFGLFRPVFGQGPFIRRHVPGQRRGQLRRCRRSQFGQVEIEVEFLRDPRQNRRRLWHPPRAEFAARHRPLVGIHHRNACLAQPIGIALGRRMLPHPNIHCGHGQHRFVGRKDQRGRQIVGDACGHLRQQVGSGGAHHDEVRFAAELDMPHLDLVLEIEQRGIDLVLAQSGKRHRGNELLAAIGQHTGYLPTRLADQAHELARFVGGDAPADNEQDLRAAHAALSPRGFGPARPGADRQVHTHCLIAAFASAPSPVLPARSTGSLCLSA